MKEPYRGDILRDIYVERAMASRDPRVAHRLELARHRLLQSASAMARAGQVYGQSGEQDDVSENKNRELYGR